MYKLPELRYSYKALEPHISEEQLRIHHTKHHNAYVEKANKALDEKNWKALTFNLAGHILHELFWNNLTPESKEEGKVVGMIEKQWGSLEKFKEDFTDIAATVQGSGWAALAYDKDEDKLIIMQIEKHNVNVVPILKLLLVVDVWEHAYYLDYANARGEFLTNFWKIVNWEEVDKRLE